MRSGAVGLGLLGLVIAGWAEPAAPPSPTAADTVSFAVVDAGVDTPTWCGRPEKPHLLESGGAGLALIDYDGDGDLDLYVVDGWRLAGTEVSARGANQLYRNDGDWRMIEVGAAAGVADAGWGTGVAGGDVDADGDIDLFISNFGPDVLYRNRGDGTFEEVSGGPGIDGWSTGAVFFDADRDGDEDLYLGAYVDCSLEEVLLAEPALDWEGMKVMFGPFGLEGRANLFWENTGAGEFVERTADAGLVDAGLFYTFAVVAADFDGDLDLDLYAANDSNPNYLYENRGGRFEEVGLWSGAALDTMGNAQAGMGLAAGDVDGDGRLDLFVTNFYKDVSTFYRNLGDLLFEDVTEDLGLRSPTYAPLSWGAELADLNQDGRLDLVVANGHIYPQADRAPTTGTSFRQRNTLLVGSAAGFEDRSAASGAGLEVAESSRGLASGDLDGDGDLDLAVWNMDAPPTLLRNDSGPGAWLLVDAPASVLRLEAVVRGRAPGERLVRHRVLGGSYVSVSDTRLHFGLGMATEIERLTAHFAGGRRARFADVPSGRSVRLRR